MGDNTLQHLLWGIKMSKWRTQIMELEGLISEYHMEDEKWYDYNDHGRQKKARTLVYDTLQTTCSSKICV